MHAAAHGEESIRVRSNWRCEESLEMAFPNPPRITNGDVVVHATRELVAT